jgi:hypothetical protein
LYRGDLAEAPGHPFYLRLNELLGLADYKRHGTTSLFAALELKTSRVIGRFESRALFVGHNQGVAWDVRFASEPPALSMQIRVRLSSLISGTLD